MRLAHPRKSNSHTPTADKIAESAERTIGKKLTPNHAGCVPTTPARRRRVAELTHGAPLTGLKIVQLCPTPNCAHPHHIAVTTPTQAATYRNVQRNRTKVNLDEIRDPIVAELIRCADTLRTTDAEQAT